MSTGPKKDNRGGARVGAGRKPPITLSEQQCKKMLRQAKAYEKKYGKAIDEILLDFIYGETQEHIIPAHEVYDAEINSMIPVPEKTQYVIPMIKDRATCIKLWKDFTAPKVEAGSKADQNLGPGIYLPEAHQDPAKKVVPING